MFRRFLLIGVGGSGGKTLRFLRRNLLERLEAVDWTDGIPVGWQFLQIDVPPAPDGNAPDLPPQLPDGSYTGLVVPGIVYSNLDSALLPSSATERMLGGSVGWRPDPEQVSVNVAAGAGQYRTLGRVIALANLSRVRTAVERALERMSSPDAVPELNRLTERFGNPPVNAPPAPVALVVSSIAGGTGAGMFLDVCDILRAQGQSWTSDAMAVLYAPDVFDDLPDVGRSGVYPNALAALSELMAGYWNRGAAGELEYALYAPAGVQMGDLKGRGPRHPFLIGRANQKVSFGGQVDVYAGVGSALAALLTSASAQDDLVAYFFANKQNAAGAMSDTLGLKTPIDEPPFSSFGFATVSLGRDRFGRYAAERLARASVEHLLRAHWVGRDVPEKTKPEEALEEVRRLSFEWFLADSGLNELGEEHNDILDGLRAPNHTSTIDQGAAQALTKVTEGVTQLAPSAWGAALSGAFNALEPKVLAQLRIDAEERARTEWVPMIQRRLQNLVALGLARDGAPVTRALLISLSDELSEVINELRREEEKFRRWASHRDAGIQEELNHFGDRGLMPANHEFLVRAAEKAKKALGWAADADLHAFAAALARELQEGLVAPLERAVAEGIAVLEREDNPTPGAIVSAHVREWPDGALLPRRYEPAVNERLVEDTSGYGGMYDDRLTRTTGAKTASEAERLALGQVVLGGSDQDGQTVLELSTEWWPARLSTGSMPPSKAVFRAHLAAGKVLQRAKRWANRPNTAMGEYLGEHLREYLDPGKVGAAELGGRLDRFKGAFTEAIDLAAPLVNINAGVLRKTHGMDSPPRSYSFTEIPFPPGSPGREIVESVLQARGINPEDARIAKAFGTGEQARVDILSSFDAPFEPVVFESLMGPIGADWLAKKGVPTTRRSFWRWRRSRPLNQFIPMAPGVRRSFVTGWFAARILGQLEAGRDDSEPISVYVPSEQQWAKFPFPLITRALEEVDLLPAVLESLPTALVDYATAGGREDPLLAYQRLTQLGQESGPPLQRWVLEGRTDPGAPVPRERFGTPAADAKTRKDKVLQYLDDRRKHYGEFIDMSIDRRNFFSVNHIWELRDDVRHAFGELRMVVEAIRESGVDDGD